MLAGSTEYGTPVDVWACACLAAEMSSGRPLFPGEDEGEVVSSRAAAGTKWRSSGKVSLMHYHTLMVGVVIVAAVMVASKCVCIYTTGVEGENARVTV